MFRPLRRPSLGAMNTTRFFVKAAGVTLAAAGLIATLLMPSAGAAEFTTQTVIGGWIGELPCPFTSAAPSADNQSAVPFECVSGTTWDGAWVGHTVYRAVGTVDLVSGDFHATLDETLTGLVAATRQAGTLHLLGTVDVVGATGECVVHERMVGGTGAFAGSTGTVEFDGNQVAVALGHGGYHGTWSHR
jgi:hypothetical protein